MTDHSKMLEYRGLKLYAAIICALATYGSLTAVPDASDWRVARGLDRVLSNSALEGAFVGVLAVDLRTGRTLYSRNADLFFLPASNQKLLTTAAALHWLGPEFRYATCVRASGSVGPDSVLRGDLVVNGSGDPSLSRTFGIDPDSVFRSWADSLKARGVARISGSVVGDESTFDQTRLGYGWDWHYLSFWYAPEVSALSCGDNSVVMHVSPAKSLGERAGVELSPRTSFVSVVNNSCTGNPGCGDGVTIQRTPGANEIHVGGHIPADAPRRSYRISVSDPALFFAHRLTEALRQGSVRVDGEPRSVSEACTLGVEMFSHHSPELESIVAVTNRLSANLGAEMLLKTMGVRAFGKGTFRDGCRAVKAYLSTTGSDTSGLHCVDGSGLSRRNLVSPRMLVDLLMARWEEDSTGGLFASLPVSGSEGTLEGRMRDEYLAGRVHAKTGTLDQTSTLAGYVLARGRRPVAFVIMSNHFIEDLSKVRSLEDEMVGVLARYRPRYEHPRERR